MYKTAMKSVIGTRNEQQDQAFEMANDSGVVAVVCDGMGGLENGRVASVATVEKFKELFGKKDPKEPFPEFFLNTIDVLDEFVYHLNNRGGERVRAGTTIVAAAIEKNDLYWLSVGDSRLYILRGEEFVQVTRDHNYFFHLNRMISDREINEIEYIREAVRGEALISFVGMGGIEVMDINNEPFKLQPGDTILLTSDGLYKALSDEEIKHCLRRTDVDDASDALVGMASKIAYRSQDNTTCVIIRYEGEADIQ